MVKDNVIIAEICADVDASKNLQANLQIIEENIETLLAQNNITSTHLKGIGIAFPGLYLLFE